MVTEKKGKTTQEIVRRNTTEEVRWKGDIINNKDQIFKYIKIRYPLKCQD